LPAPEFLEGLRPPNHLVCKCDPYGVPLQRDSPSAARHESAKTRPWRGQVSSQSLWSVFAHSAKNRGPSRRELVGAERTKDERAWAICAAPSMVKSDFRRQYSCRSVLNRRSNDGFRRIALVVATCLPGDSLNNLDRPSRFSWGTNMADGRDHGRYSSSLKGPTVSICTYADFFFRPAHKWPSEPVERKRHCQRTPHTVIPAQDRNAPIMSVVFFQCKRCFPAHRWNIRLRRFGFGLCPT